MIVGLCFLGQFFISEVLFFVCVFLFFVFSKVCYLVIMCRRDSFITHRAFCDALAVESAKEPVAPPSVEEEPDPQTVDPSPPSPPVQSPPSVPTSSAAISLVLPDQTPGDLSGNCNIRDLIELCWV